jgi:hypothetical protein
MVMGFFSGWFLGSGASTLRGFAASGGRHAQLLPLAGEEEKSKVEPVKRHDARSSLAANC